MSFKEEKCAGFVKDQDKKFMGKRQGNVYLLNVEESRSKKNVEESNLLQEHGPVSAKDESKNMAYKPRAISIAVQRGFGAWFAKDKV